MKAPCKDCPERHPHCHGQCERYKAFRAARDAAIAAKQKDTAVITYIVVNEDRAAHNRHVHRKK